MTISLPHIRKNLQFGFGNLKLVNWLLNSHSLAHEEAIQYQNSTDDIWPAMLRGFFEGWPDPPDSAAHLRILRGSLHVVLALDPARERVIGYITALSDGVSAAYIPHLEVLPEYRGQGIGSELVRRMFAQLNGIYMIDLLCDDDVAPFYEKLGMSRSTGMLIRNYENQAGLRLGHGEQHW